MLRGLLLVLAGLAAGFAIAWWRAPVATRVDAPFLDTSDSSVVAPRPADNDVAALAAALEAERSERAALAARVDELAATLQTLGSANAAASMPASAESCVLAEPASPPRFRRPPVVAEDSQGRQVERLLAAGFAPDRAEWIAQRTAELRMAQLQAQYDSAREGKPFDPTGMLAGEQTLRTDLGDADYERYLQALDRPTSVPVLRPPF